MSQTVSPNREVRQHIEQRALSLSMYGTVLFAGLGLFYGWFVHSQAIILDGVFSLINMVMCALTLWVAKLVERPDDATFQFGYTHFEPLLNVGKSLVMLGTCTVALFGAIGDLLQGGRPIRAGDAAIYAVIATVGCFVFAKIESNVARKKVKSQLVVVEAKEWFLDGILSAGVLVGFLIAFFLERSQWRGYVNYLDPSLVVMLSLATVGFPVRILKSNLPEVLVMAPAQDLQQRIRTAVNEIVREFGFETSYIRMAKEGRSLNLNIYFVLPTGYPLGKISELDHVRRRLRDRLGSFESYLWLDIIFTGDDYWAVEG